MPNQSGSISSVTFKMDRIIATTALLLLIRSMRGWPVLAHFGDARQINGLIIYPTKDRRVVIMGLPNIGPLKLHRKLRSPVGNYLRLGRLDRRPLGMHYLAQLVDR